MQINICGERSQFVAQMLCRKQGWRRQRVIARAMRIERVLTPEEYREELDKGESKNCRELPQQRAVGRQAALQGVWHHVDTKMLAG